MPRTSNASIIEWGTPPESAPAGWDAVRIALDGKPGEWANVGHFTVASARKVSAERLPTADGYEHRIVKRDDGRADVWVRKVAADTDDTPADPAQDESSAQIGVETRATPARKR